MRIAAIQLQVDAERTADERLKDACDGIRSEAGAGADVVVLPEMWYPGYFGFDHYDELAESLDGPVVTALAAAAAEAGVVVMAGSIVERSEAGLHNTSLLLGRDGRLLASYRKIHLFPYGSREEELLTRGTAPAVVDVDGVRTGLSTCYDLRYPELYRRMVDDGAELFLVVAAWPVPRLDAWRTLGRARAIENQAVLVGCNAAGVDGDVRYLGSSYAFNAWGSCLGELDDRAGVLRVDVDPAATRAARDEFPALAGRVL